MGTKRETLVRIHELLAGAFHLAELGSQLEDAIDRALTECAKLLGKE